MEQQREIRNSIVTFLLFITNIHFVSSSNQNLYAFTTTIGIGSTGVEPITNYIRLQPSRNTTTIYHDSTTYSPASTSIRTEEEPDTSEIHIRNRYVQPSYRSNKSVGEDDDPDGPSDHAIPYSIHEEARDVPTKPKYVAPGVWAKPPPERDIPLDFVPTKLHAQVRGTHTVKRLPQRQAIDSAETNEEKLNAPRLREIVTNSKVNTIYSEEGYEDSAYDHAGHVRDADFHEGFARKLHEENGHHSLNEYLAPNEFEEYDEDYQDHAEESNEQTKVSDDKDNLIDGDWNGSALDPKLMIENGIRELEEDIKKDAEEIERTEKIYRSTQESQLRNDVKDDSSESEKSHGENDVEDEENKSAKTKEKKSKSHDEKLDAAHKGTEQSRKLEQKKKRRKKKKKIKRINHENYETTVFPSNKTSTSNTEILTTPYDFAITDPSNSQVYSIDQTTLRYIAPITAASYQQIDEPRTISYSQLFWDYFKARQDPSITESFTLVPDSTTMNPQSEEQTPIAMATIDGHGPYLLMTKEMTTTSPSVFLGTHSFHPQNLFSDRVGFDLSSSQGYDHHLLGRNDNVNYVSGVVAASTVATYTSVQPLLSESLTSVNTENGEYLTSTIFPDTTVSSSTPVVMTFNITQQAYSRIVDYKENPFLGPILDNSNITVIKNKSKYRVLARSKSPPDKKPVKSIAHQQVSPSSTSEKQDEYKKIRDELNAKYSKMLNDIINKQKILSLPEKKKIAFPADVTLMRSPIRQRFGYSIFPTARSSVADHPSVSVESESPRIANWKNLHQHRSQRAELPLRSAYVQTPIYHKNQFPATKLLPPPMQPASSYVNYYSNKQKDDYHPYIGGKTQQHRDNAFRYFPLIPKDSWRTRSRRKRFDEGESRDGGDYNGTVASIDVKATANNGVTNDGQSERRDKGSLSRIIDRSEGKSSNRKLIDAPIDVLDKTRLASPVRSKNGKSDAATTLIDKNINGEDKNVEDVRETVIGNPIVAEKISNQSIKRNGHVNYRNINEQMKNRRNVSRDETRSGRNMRNRKSHDELLNESPKISGDVIDKEIAVRFNEQNNETSAKIKEERKVEVEIPSFDYAEEFAEDSLVKFSTTTEAAIDMKKYPFYNNNNVPSASVLKYVVDPETVPRKTSRGMEFYDSRNAYKRCDEVEPDLEKVLPEKEEPNPERGPQEDLPRLRGLGDKLDCFKAKYFDDNPLDSPLFAEKLVEDPIPPSELNPMKFATMFEALPKENDDYVVHRVSKKPERNGRQWRNRNRPYETYESIRVNYKHDPQSGRGRNAYLHTVRGSRPSDASRRRVKNRKSKPKPFTSAVAQSPRQNQTAFYQKQVYEDVMGNIRNLVNSYQVYETTTLPPSTQILATAGSENILKVTEITSIPPKEKDTSASNVTDVVSNTKSLEIKGLVPPPKYSAPRQTSYRIYRPLPKSRMSLLRSPSLSRIIAHHHAIKVKRSAMNIIAKNFSQSTINENEKSDINDSIKVDAVANDIVVKSTKEAINETATTSEPSDLEIEESRRVNTYRNLSINSKIKNAKRQKGFTNSDQKDEPSHRTVYTIRDRIRYSKPKWDTRGFGKFNVNSEMMDENSRRKEPRYNNFRRKKKLIDRGRQKNSTITNSIENTLGIKSTASSIEGRESSTTEVYHAEESVVHEIYHRRDEYPDPEKAESVVTKSEENLFEEENEDEESTTNAYRVHEDVNEDIPTPMRSINPQNSKEVMELQKYLESDPPGYAETFPEDAKPPSNGHPANMNHESDDPEEKQEEDTDFPKNMMISSDDSSEKAEEQIETPMRTKSSDDDSEELSSKEEKNSNKDQTFFTYRKRPSSIEDNNDDKPSYKRYPFSRYKMKLKKESEENSEEEEKEGSEDYVFPWHADKEDKDKEATHKWLWRFNRYEYPWERRERLARERRKERGRANRLRQLFFGDEAEEESVRNEKPVYPWEKYDNVASKSHVNTRRDISPKYTDDGEESNSEPLPVMKFSSRYSSRDKKPSLNAREIGRSIQEFLEKDIDESKEDASTEIEDRYPSFARKSSFSDRGISKGKLVPEDITQPSRRRKTRRNPEFYKTNSHFGQRKPWSKEIAEVEKEERTTGSNESNLNDTVSQIEASNQQNLSLNGTAEISLAIEPRRKKRRKILKNNSTISFDSASAEYITKPTKKKRRKPQASTTSTTPSANIDVNESRFTPIQRIYLTDATVTNDSSEQTTIPKTTATRNLQVETSTPKIRTIEHRSRVSKEKIVTKTTYPDETKNFGSRTMNVTSLRKDPARNLKTKLRRKKNKHNNNNNNNNNNGNRNQVKNDKGDYNVKFKNSENKDNPLKSFGIQKEEVKKINDFNTYDGIVNDEDVHNNDFRTSSEIYAVSNLIHNIPPSRSDKTDGKIKNESNKINEEEKEEDIEEKRKLLLQTKFAKDPERRLYYYVERK